MLTIMFLRIGNRRDDVPSLRVWNFSTDREPTLQCGCASRGRSCRDEGLRDGEDSGDQETDVIAEGVPGDIEEQEARRVRYDPLR